MPYLSFAFILLMVIVDVALTTGQSNCTPTASDALGSSFYLSDAQIGQPPFMVCNNTPTDDRLFISGTVMSTLCMGIENVELEIWQAFPDGTYSQGNDWSCRTIIQTDANGQFNFSTVMPGREAYMGSYRPANIHFRVTALNGYSQLTTEAYFNGDLYLAPNDPCMSCNSDDPTLLIQLTPCQGDIKTWTGEWNIVLETAPSTTPSNIVQSIIGKVKPIVQQIGQEVPKVAKQISQAGNILKNALKRPGR
jgi:protocatechuate 3,4-dioxygenase beta subunit